MHVSLSGAVYCEKFIFSVFLGDDIIPRLSISSAFDLKIRLLTTLLNCDLPKVSMLVICTARIGQAHNRFAAMGLAGRQMLIDCCSNGMRRANVGSATLSAYVGG